MSTTDTRRTFAPRPSSAGEARRFLDSVLSAPELVLLNYTATMLVSELVTNAVLHAGTPLEVVVILDADHVRVEVHDESPLLPMRKHYSAMSGTGRGLMLVERMASEWGAERTNGGKVVWFELDGTTAPVLGLIDADAL